MSEPEEGSILACFIMPLPPTANHQYRAIVKRGKDGGLHGANRKADRYKAWLDEVKVTVVRGWEPPAKTPLTVHIRLALPQRMGRNADIDGFVKPLIDATVGKHRDQWVDRLLVLRAVQVGCETGSACVVVFAGVLAADYHVSRGREMTGDT